MADRSDPRVGDPRVTRVIGHKVNPAEGSKPTPTQDENDRFALGEHIVEHEADGSPEQEPRLAVSKDDLKRADEQARADAAEKLSRGKPTLTQEENDRAKLEGLVVGEEHEDDGSGPDPFEEQRQEQRKREQELQQRVQSRQMEAGKDKPAGQYQTRASQARQQPRPLPPPAPNKSE